MLLPAVKMSFGQNGGQTNNSQKGQKVDKLITLRHIHIYIYLSLSLYLSLFFSFSPTLRIVILTNLGPPSRPPKHLLNAGFWLRFPWQIQRTGPETPKLSESATPEENAHKVNVVNFGGWGWGSQVDCY